MELVGQKTKCKGSGSNQGKVTSVSECEALCADASSMFSFGTNDFGGEKCVNGNCECVCEEYTQADSDCEQVVSTGYRLYWNPKFSKKCIQI